MLLDLEGTGQMDVTAADALVELAGELERQDLELRLARVHKPVLEVLRRDGLIERIGEDRIHGSVHEGAEGFHDTAG